MSDDNRRTAVKLLEAFTADGLDGAGPYLADGFTWWTPRMGEVQDRLAGIAAAAKRHLKAPMTLTITGSTAEGDRVALEAVSDGELNNGKIYHNHYHFLLLFKDGKVTAVKEYNDSKHAAETWEGLL